MGIISETSGNFIWNEEFENAGSWVVAENQPKK